ncbi:hypothetical protein ABMA28_008191 [Loxostege sticticalis]|uniref:UDP-glucuronosyltransferase n=2 Tax=Loxostege sticticalis TaxID=481309 RepID=A0ABD0SGB4_LOXSC
MWFISIFLLISAVNSEAYKVLLCFPFPARSMNNLGEGYVRHLLDAGHEVTYITPFPKKQNTPNLRQIDVSDNEEILANDNFMNISYILDNIVEPSSDVEYLQDMSLKIALRTLQNKNVKTLIENPKETFDVVVVDLLETELYAGFAALYNCPLVWAYSMGAHWVPMRLIDDPTNPAYSSDYFTTSIAPFSFTERFKVLVEHMKWRYAKTFKTMPKEEDAYINIFGPEIKKRGLNVPDYEDLIYNASLILSNGYHASGKIPNTPQNWKFVGGFHIEDPAKPLPEDLKSIMDSSKNGVIYFSMGSVWRSELIPKKITDGLLKVFGELKATVIWKYEGNLQNLPKNVHIVKWAPQQSILAHPNCRLFITHAGLLSSTEAVHFGVPVIGVPISYDQYININSAVDRGYALQVTLSYNLPKDLKSAIDVVFNNPRYKDKVKELSKLYHDRPITPGKELVYWIEFVVRTRGATHLRSPALLVPFYQKAYLDVVAVASIAMAAIGILLKNLCFGDSERKRRGRKEKRN